MSKLGAFDAYVQDEQEKQLRAEYEKYKQFCKRCVFPLMPFAEWCSDDAYRAAIAKEEAKYAI